MSSRKNCGGFSHHTQVGFDKDQPCGEKNTCINREIEPLTIDVWDDPGCEGDNVVRLYNMEDCVTIDGYMYWPLRDGVVSQPPSVDWSEPKTLCEALKPVEKCGGGFVDGPVVQCDQICEVFPTTEATEESELLFCDNGTPGSTTFSKLLNDACLEFPEVPSNTCGLRQLVEGEDENGCKKAYVLNPATNCFPEITPTGITGTKPTSYFTPTDPSAANADIGYYTENTLVPLAAADPFVGGSTIDRALLEQTLVAASEGPMTLSCDTRINFQVFLNNIVYDNMGNNALGDLVYTYDDGSGEQVMLLGGGSSTFPIAKFTNSQTQYTANHEYTLPAGSYTFKAYLVGNGTTTDIAQIKAGGTNLAIIPCKKIG